MTRTDRPGTGPTARREAPGPGRRRPYVEDLVDVLHRQGERPVLRSGGRDTTAAALLAAIHRTARALLELGIGRGDLVALFAPNRPEALAVRYATHLVGAASVYLSAPPEADKRAQMLVDFAPRLVVVFPETAHLLAETAAPVAAVGPVPGVELRLDELAAAQPAEPLPCRARPDDLAVLISSGGTTGVPKGSLRDFTAWTAAVTAPSRPDRRQLADGKLAYLTQILVDVTLLGGGTVVLEDRFDPALALATIEAEGITDLFLVEPQLFELMDHPDAPRRDLRSLRTLTHIGAAAPPTLRRRARERLGPVIAHTYGASEMGIVSAITPAEQDLGHLDRFTCAGRVVPGVDVRFRRVDGGLDAGDGSIEVRSPAMAQGYRHRPREQAANFVDGWYRSGDLGHLDGDGYLHVLGRGVDCTEVDGVLVTPVGVQDTLCRVPEVRYAVVVVDRDHGTRIAAAVPWPGRTVLPDACRAAVAAEHGRAVADTVVVLPMDRIPLTEQGKPDRPELRRRAAALRVRSTAGS
ncbi:class I adenylate-forming enzyme family protein [Geodermatophilus sp. SYSU D01105]